MRIVEKDGKSYPGNERAVIEKVYQTILKFHVSDVAELRRLTDNNLENFGVSNIFELNEIMEKHVELLKMYLDSQR